MSNLKFKEGNCVQVLKTRRIGIVSSVSCRWIGVTFWDRTPSEPETLNFLDSDLRLAALPEISVSDLGPLVRAEKTVSELSRGTNLISDQVKDDGTEYRITLADLYEGIGKMYLEFRDPEDIYIWFLMLDMFRGSTGLYEDLNSLEGNALVESCIMRTAHSQMRELCRNYAAEIAEYDPRKEPGNAPWISLGGTLAMIEEWFRSEQTRIPEAAALAIAKEYDADTIDEQSEEVQSLFRKCLDQLCDSKVPLAIQRRGYCYYIGTKVYPNDWVRARDAFLEYYALTGDASAANTLGYIYYYGRCNKGVPEYDQAFRYFSIGHAYGYFESTYKLADMFAHGYSVVKNGETAFRLYLSVFAENLDSFCKGVFDCNFADAALRMGNCYRYGTGCEKDPEGAYFYYLQADLAIRKRIEETDYYGDTVVYNNIQRALAEARKEYTVHTRKVIWDHPGWKDRIFGQGMICRMKIRELKDGALSLTVHTVAGYDEEDDPAVLLTVPGADYCDLVREIRLHTAKYSTYMTAVEDDVVFFDHCEFDPETGTTVFFLNFIETCEIKTRHYTLTLPKKKKEEPSGRKYHFAGIRFGETGRIYDYLCEDETVVPGDRVIVTGYDGEAAVEVVEVSDKYESELGLPVEKYKHVLRKAEQD